MGGLEETRGVEVAINALPRVRAVLPDVLLTIVGTGTSESRLKALVASLKLESNVLFAGYVEQRHIPSLIRAADVGLVPHYVTEHSDTTLPNKLFDYMAQGRPVVVTQASSMRAVVEPAGCGRVYGDKDPADLARVLLDLAHPEVRATLGQAALRAVTNQYNWAVDEQVLLSAVKSICSGRSPTSGRSAMATPAPISPDVDRR